MTGFRCDRRIDSRETLADAIRAATAVGSPGTAMLLAALLEGRIALLPCGTTTSNGRLKKFFSLTSDRPAIVLAGFDDGSDAGPDDWAAARCALDWARWTMVHGAGYERWQYQLALDAALMARRVLIVECSSVTLPSWGRFVRSASRQPAGITIRPRNGLHPLPEKVGVLQ